MRDKVGGVVDKIGRYPDTSISIRWLDGWIV